jgi:hypothetical protein
MEVTNLNCRDWKKRLPILLDEPPESGERRALAEHLANCPSCSGEWALLASLKQEARKLPELEPGAHLWERIRERMHEGPAEVKVKEPWWRALVPAPMPKIGWALAPAAAILIGLLVFHWGEPAQEVAKAGRPRTAPVAAAKDSNPKVAEISAAPEKPQAVLTRMPERRERVPRWSPDTIPLFVIETLEPQGQRVYVDAQTPDTEQPVFVIHEGRVPGESFIPAPSNYLMPVVSMRKGTDF